LRDELKDLEVNLFLYQYDRVHEKLTQISETMRQMNEERELAEAGETTLLSTCAGLEEQLKALDSALNTQQNKLMGLVSEAETRVGTSHVLTERRENALSTQKRIEQERGQSKARMEELGNVIAGLQADESGKRRSTYSKKRWRVPNLVFSRSIPTSPRGKKRSMR
jgi:chromosome segregation protein